MMSDKDLERRLAELRDHWRVADEPPLDRMWERIEADAFTAPRRFLPRWIRPILPLAATLILGFGSVSSPSAVRPHAADSPSRLGARQGCRCGCGRPRKSLRASHRLSRLGYRSLFTLAEYPRRKSRVLRHSARDLLAPPCC